jgi:hypothetical protein
MVARDTVTTERFGTSYWSCTWCAAIAGVRHVKTPRLGPPQTEAEVRALYSRSGDTDFHDGSNLRQMLTAVRARYGLSWRAEPSVSAARLDQLAHTVGAGIVFGCTASLMPSSIRRYYGGFGGGHRSFGAVYESGGFQILDPMMPRAFGGVRVHADDLFPAIWRAEVVLVHAPREVPPPPPPPAVELRYHGTAYRKTATVRGDHTNVRTSPYIRDDNVARQLGAGATFAVYQRTTQGTRTSGSSTWYGDREGDAWVHASVVQIR